MKQLNKWQNAIFIVSAILMVAGAVFSILRWGCFPYIYAVGAIGYVCMQMLQRYEGTNFTILRLRRIMLLSNFLLLFVAICRNLFQNRDLFRGKILLSKVEVFIDIYTTLSIVVIVMSSGFSWCE